MNEIISIGSIVLMFIVQILFLVFLFKLMDTWLNGSDSYKYRKTMTNLYVISKIKEKAKTENIDLTEEYKEFYNIINKKNIRDLDTQIEQQLIEKIEPEDNNKK